MAYIILKKDGPLSGQESICISNDWWKFRWLNPEDEI